MQRYFTKNEDLSITEKDIHHIKNVMRMQVNDKIEIVHNKKVYLAKIKTINPFSIEVIQELEDNNELDVEITIAFGLVKEQKMDMILQKLTELGVKRIIPLQMERSIVKLDDKRFLKKKERWESICKEASEQSHRNIIPEVGEIMNLEQLVKLDADLKIVSSTKEKKNFINKYLQNNKKCAKIIVVIGPEGGISESEENYLNKNGYVSVTLGSRILRIETACLYLASVLNYHYMR